MDSADKRMLVVAFILVLITALVILGGAGNGRESAQPHVEEQYRTAEDAPVVVPLPPEEDNQSNRYEEVGLPERNR